jgi:hypothetical protein
MSKLHTIYNQVGVFIGPAPSTGYNFISSDGILNNDYDVELGNYCLVFPLKRVTSTSFQFVPNRIPVSSLGNLGTIKNSVLNSTEVRLNIDYNLMGLINEVRIGLIANIPSGNSFTGQMLYGTGRVSPISGYYSRSTVKSQDTEIGWPLKQREPKNIFIAVRKDYNDFNDTTSGTYNSGNIYVYGFGDCFLTSYSCGCGIGTVPNIKTSFICNNVEVYNSGINCGIPSINSQNQNSYSGIKFSIPNNYEGVSPTVFLPSDLTIDIKNSSNSTDLSNLAFDFTDIKLQDFNFSFNLERNPLYKLGHKYPLDKPFKFPVIGNLAFNAIVGDNKAGSLSNLLIADEDYDINLKLRYQRKQSFSGIGIQYDFLRAKFNNLDSSLSIQDKNIISFSFSFEMNPSLNYQGLFISGYLGVPHRIDNESIYLGDYFNPPSLDELLTEDLDLIAISTTGFKILY